MSSKTRKAKAGAIAGTIAPAPAEAVPAKDSNIETKQMNPLAKQALALAVDQFLPLQQRFIQIRDSIIGEAAKQDGIDPKDGWRFHPEQLVWFRETPEVKAE